MHAKWAMGSLSPDGELHAAWGDLLSHQSSHWLEDASTDASLERNYTFSEACHRPAPPLAMAEGLSARPGLACVRSIASFVGTIGRRLPSLTLKAIYGNTFCPSRRPPSTDDAPWHATYALIVRQDETSRYLIGAPISIISHLYIEILSQCDQSGLFSPSVSPFRLPRCLDHFSRIRSALLNPPSRHSAL